MTDIRIRKGETLDKALRRLKKRLDRENVIKDARNNRYYEKPSVRRRRKMKVAKFSQMLRTRYADNKFKVIFWPEVALLGGFRLFF